MTFSIARCAACDALAPLFDGLCPRCAQVRAQRRLAVRRALLARYGVPMVVRRVEERDWSSQPD